MTGIQTTGVRTAEHLGVIAQRAKAAREEAFRQKCAPELDRVQRTLDSIEIEAYWEELQQVAAVEPNYHDRATGRTPYRHLLLERSPDSDILEHIKTHVIAPWIRDKLCNGIADHGFSTMQVGPRLMLTWSVTL